MLKLPLVSSLEHIMCLLLFHSSLIGHFTAHIIRILEWLKNTSNEYYQLHISAVAGSSKRVQYTWKARMREADETMGTGTGFLACPWSGEQKKKKNSLEIILGAQWRGHKTFIGAIANGPYCNLLNTVRPQNYRNNAIFIIFLLIQLRDLCLNNNYAFSGIYGASSIQENVLLYLKIFI